MENAISRSLSVKGRRERRFGGINKVKEKSFVWDWGDQSLFMTTGKEPFSGGKILKRHEK